MQHLLGKWSGPWKRWKSSQTGKLWDSTSKQAALSCVCSLFTANYTSFTVKIGTVLPNMPLRSISRSGRNGNRFCRVGQAHSAAPTPVQLPAPHTHIRLHCYRRWDLCHGVFTGLYISVYQHIWKYLEIFEGDNEMETSLSWDSLLWLRGQINELWSMLCHSHFLVPFIQGFD